jgi:hypothetical protein
MPFDYAAPFDHGASNRVRPLMSNFNGDRIHFFRPSFEAVVKCLHQANIGELLRLGLGIVARTGNCGREKVKAGWWQAARADLCFS